MESWITKRCISLQFNKRSKGLFNTIAISTSTKSYMVTSWNKLVSWLRPVKLWLPSLLLFLWQCKSVVSFIRSSDNSFIIYDFSPWNRQLWQYIQKKIQILPSLLYELNFPICVLGKRDPFKGVCVCGYALALETINSHVCVLSN